MNTIKALSKEDVLDDQTIQALAKWVKSNWNPQANKYLALIVSKFDYDQLILFAKTQKEMEE